MTSHFGEILDQLQKDSSAVQTESNVRDASRVTVTTPQEEGQLYDEVIRFGKSAKDLRVDAKIRRAQLAQDRNVQESKRSAALSEWLAVDGNNALVSYDDYERMDRLNTMSERLAQFKVEPADMGSWIWNTAMSLPTGITTGFGSLYAQGYGLVQFASDLTGLDTLSDFAADQAWIGRNLVPALRANIIDDATPGNFDFQIQQYQNQKKNMLGVNFAVPWTEIAFRIDVDDVFSAGTSLVPTIAVGMMTGGMSTSAQLSLMAATAGGQSFGSTYSEKRAQGKDILPASGDATLAFVITGALTRVMPGGVERGIGQLTRMMKSSAKPTEVLRMNLVKAIGKDIAEEFTEEGLDDLAQALLVDGVGFEEAMSRGLKAGILGGILGGGVGVSSRLSEVRLAPLKRAKDFAEENRAVALAVSQTETVNRSNEIIGQFMQKSGGVNKEVYIAPDIVNDFIEANPESKESFDNMNVTSEVIAKSRNDGIPISMDLARMHGNLSGPTLEFVISNMTETTFSPSEAEASVVDEIEVQKQAESDMQGVKQERDSFSAETDRIIKEYMGAKNVPREFAADAVAPLIRSARTMFQRHKDGFASSASDALKRYSIVKGKAADAGAEKVPDRARVDPEIIGDTELGDSFKSRAEYYQSLPADGGQEQNVNQGQDGNNDVESVPLGSLKITEDGYIISLFENSDLSTILHETGHIFLEETLNILSTGTASNELVRDWNSIADWQVKNKSEHITYLKQQLRGKIEPERRAEIQGAIDFFNAASDEDIRTSSIQMSHNVDGPAAIGVVESMSEMWARGFESYVREGNSPSQKMRAAFGRFRRWLSRIYASALNLNVKMDEDARNMFNNILATDAEIQQTKADAGFMDFPENTTDLITVKKRGKINTKIREMNTKAADKIFAARAKVADQTRKELRDPVTKEVMSRPVYKAWTLVNKGGGFSSAEVERSFGKETLGVLRRRGMIAKIRPTKKQESEDNFDFDPDVLESISDLDESYIDAGMFAPSNMASTSGIPLGSGDSETIINVIDDMGGIKNGTKKDGLYSDKPDMRGAIGRVMRKKDDGQSPDVIAKQLESQGFGDGSVNTMWKLIRSDIDTRNQNKIDFKQAKKDEAQQLREYGMLPDMVAMKAGFADADTMINELLDARNPMREIKFSLEVAAMNSGIELPFMSEVLISDEFADVSDTIGEYLRLAFKGSENPVKRSVLRDRAQLNMVSSRMKDAVRGDKFEGIVRKSFNAERKAIANNDYVEATLKNEEVRYYTELARESNKIKTSRNQLILFARKIPKIDKKSIEYAYWYQAHQLAARFGFIKKVDGLPIPTHGVTLEGLMSGKREDGTTDEVFEDIMDMSYDFEPWIIAEEKSSQFEKLQQDAIRDSVGKKYTTPLHQMVNVYEFSEIDRLLRLLVHRGKSLKSQSVVDGKFKLDALVAESIESSKIVADHDKTDKNGVPIRNKNVFMHKYAKRLFDWVGGELMMIDPAMKTIDGYNGARAVEFDPNKPMAKSIQIPSLQADHKRQNMNKEIFDLLEPHKKVLGEAMKRLGKGRVSDMKVTDNQRRAHQQYWDAEMVIGLALNMGNSYNMNAVAEGIGWMMKDENGDLVPDVSPAYELMSLLTEKELQAIQGIWDSIDTLWAESKKVHERLYGFPPSKVDADEFTVIDANGKEVTIKGGYYPLRFDPTGIKQAVRDEKQNIKDIFSASFVPTSAKKNHLIKRKGTGGQLVMMNPSRVISEHIGMTVTMITHGEFVRDAQRIFNNNDWRNNFIQKQGAQNYKQLNGWLRGIVGREFQDLSFWDTAVNWSKRKSGIFILAFKAKGIISTADAVNTLIGAIGASNYKSGIQLIANDKQGVFTWKKMLEYSTVIRGQLKGSYDRDTKEMMDEAFDLSPFSWLDGLQKKSTKYALATYAYPAIAYQWPAWVFMYNKTLQSTGDHDLAVSLADNLIITSQPSAAKRDQSQALRTKKGFVVLSTMFRSWAFVRLQDNNFMFKSVKAGRISPSEYASYFFWTNLVSPMIFASTGGGLGASVLFGGDDEDRRAKDGVELVRRYVKGVVTDPLTGIPFVGDLVGGVIDGFSQENKTISGQVQRSITRTVQPAVMPITMSMKALDGLYDILGSDDPKEVERGMWAAAHFVSYSTGIPASKLVQEVMKPVQAITGGNK